MRKKPAYSRKSALLFAGALMLLPVTVQAAPQDGGTKGYVRVAGLFGETDEEKAARLREENQDATISDLRQRIGDLENSLRRQTGANEDLSHQVQQLNQRIDRMQKDFDYKLCQLTAQQMGGAAGGAPDSGGGLNCNPAGPSTQSGFVTAPPATTLSGSGPFAPPAGNQTSLAPPPGVLGTLPRSTAMPLTAPQATPAAGSPAHAQFETAMNLLAKAQYDAARAGFRAVADTYPDDELAQQSVYWAANIAFVQKDYPGAARTFAEELKKYPKSPRAPESMLKLGQSLIAMNQTKEGCTTLGALKAKYPDASKTIVEKAADARKDACK